MRRIQVRGAGLALALLLPLVGATGTGSVGLPEADAALDCVPHAPIAITENEGVGGYVLGHDPEGAPVYNPASGVTSGTGTRDDPYVIEGWCLWSNGTGTVTSGLRITGTDAWVVVRDNVVAGLVRGGYGVRLDGATHVTLLGNHITNHDWAGIELHGASGNVIARNTITHALRYGILLEDGSTANVVADNVITDHQQYGIYLLRTSGNRVEHNLLARSQVGVRFLLGDHHEIVRNNIRDNDWGVHLFSSRGNLFRDNNLQGHEEHGAENTEPRMLDARGNWWGCAAGPGQPGCDTVAGWVDASAWRAAPVPDAGPRPIPEPLPEP